MKKIALFIGISILTLTAVNAGSGNPVPPRNEDVNKFAHTTPNSDTLFILNTPMGRLTKGIWDNDTITKVKPVIIFVETLPIK